MQRDLGRDADRVGVLWCPKEPPQDRAFPPLPFLAPNPFHAKPCGAGEGHSQDLDGIGRERGLDGKFQAEWVHRLLN